MWLEAKLDMVFQDTELEIAFLVLQLYFTLQPWGKNTDTYTKADIATVPIFRNDRQRLRISRSDHNKWSYIILTFGDIHRWSLADQDIKMWS